MSRSASALVHERAGRVELTSLGLRAEATASPASCDFAVGATRFGALELDVAVESESDCLRVQGRVRNAGDAPLRLAAVVVELRWTGHGARSLRYLRNGWQSWSCTGARPLDDAGTPAFPSGPWLRGFHHAVGEVPGDRAGWHESELVTVVGDAEGDACLLLGAYERGEAFALVYARRAGDALEAALELRFDAELAPGESRALETLRVALGSDPSELLEAYAQDYGRRAGARVTWPTPSGWCSWYYAFHDVREDDVLRNLEALAAARDALPVEVVQIDDGFQRAIGDWRETNPKFPRGLAPLAADIRSAGFTPGLWTAPFCAVRESRLFEEHADWLLQGDDGPFQAMVHGQWAPDAKVHSLDPSRPEVTDHLEGLFADLVAMGFRYLKLDFLFVAALAARAFDDGLGRAARLRRGLEAIRRGAGDEVFLLGCGCPLGAAVGVVDGMRIGPDVAPHWRPDAKGRVPGLEETMPSTRSALRSILGRAWMHRRLWINDPDCLMVRGDDTQLSSAEREALAVAIAATGGACVFSDDLTKLDGDARRLLATTLRESAAVDGEGLPGVARVTDLLAGDIPSRVEIDGGTGRARGVVNAGEDALLRDAGALTTRIGPPPEAGRLHVAAHGGALLRDDRSPPLAVFCDFAGTFSVQDVGATLALRHGGERRPQQWARYERGEITPWDYNLEILDGLPIGVEETDAFLRSVDLDAGARALLAWCRAQGVPFRVLSDGFDWNLNRLQRIHDVRFAYAANRLRIEDGRWRIAAGHPNPHCGCGTGTCKAGLIQAFRELHPSTPTVHVGNGRVSDSCGAVAADHAFAKDSLATELAKRGEPFTPFETLHDVVPVLASLLATR
ncbi:MAG: alpha-galactosidase [Myxococcota bacterium]